MPKPEVRDFLLTLFCHISMVFSETGSSCVNLKLEVKWNGTIKDRICRGAPHVLIAHAPKDERTALAACTIALTYLELATPAFGLGACWAGYFNAAANFWPPMAEALDLPEGHVSFGAMMVGQPQFQYPRVPLRNELKTLWR